MTSSRYATCVHDVASFVHTNRLDSRYFFFDCTSPQLKQCLQCLLNQLVNKTLSQMLSRLLTPDGP
jgi:hypothetical protein